MHRQEDVFAEIVDRLCGPRARAAAATAAAAAAAAAAVPSAAAPWEAAASPIECLESASVDSLVDAAQQAADAVCSFHACLQPTIDGVELTDDPRTLLANAATSAAAASNAATSSAAITAATSPAASNAATGTAAAAAPFGPVPMLIGSALDEGDGFDAGGELDRDASATQARACLAVRIPSDFLRVLLNPF